MQNIMFSVLYHVKGNFKFNECRLKYFLKLNGYERKEGFGKSYNLQPVDLCIATRVRFSLQFYLIRARLWNIWNEASELPGRYTICCPIIICNVNSLKFPANPAPIYNPRYIK